MRSCQPVLLIALGLLLSCVSASDPGMRSGAQGTVIDTAFHGYSVRVCLDAQRLRRGVPNEVRIEVDTALGDGWRVFTKTREAVIRMDTVSGNWQVIPAVSADGVSIFFQLTGRDGVLLEPGRVILPSES